MSSYRSPLFSINAGVIEGPRPRLKRSLLTGGFINVRSESRVQNPPQRVQSLLNRPRRHSGVARQPACIVTFHLNGIVRALEGNHEDLLNYCN